MIGFPYNPNNCGFVSNQAFNANQFNGSVPFSSNNTNHLVLWDFVDNKLLWVNSITNIIEAEIGGGGSSNLPTNVGNLVINKSQLPESTLVREYYNGFAYPDPIPLITGTTNETIGAVLYIPANTFNIDDVYDFLAIAEYGYNTDTYIDDSAVKFYYNSTPNLTGATLLDTALIGPDSNGVEVYRFFQESENSRNRINSITSSITNINTSSVPFIYNTITTIPNITKDNYFIITFTPKTVGSTFAVVSFVLNKVANAITLTP